MTTIKRWDNGAAIIDRPELTIRETCEAVVRESIGLAYADLSRADLTCADLRGAILSGAMNTGGSASTPGRTCSNR